MRLIIKFAFVTSAVLSASACRTSNETTSTPQAYEDIQSISKRIPQDDYEVTCTDGTTEIVTIEQVRSNFVCNGNATKADVICISVEGGYVPVASSTGAFLGSPVREQECDRMAASANFGAVCTYNNGFGPTRIRDGRMLGRLQSLDECLESTKKSKRGVICAGYDGQIFLTNIDSGKTIGDPMPIDSCQQLLDATKFDAVCTLSQNQYFVARSQDGKFMGEGRRRSDCIEAVSHASPQVVCVGKYGLMAPARLSDGNSIGDGMMANECSAITSSAREGAICSRVGPNFIVTRIADGAALGPFGDGLDGCLQAIRSANQRVVCTANDGGYVPTRVNDGFKLGKPMPRSACTGITKSIIKNLVCSHDGNGGYTPTRISDGSRLGLPKSIIDCIDNIRNRAS